MISPACSRVASLNCLTNAAMLTPCAPSAGPTGGAGVACPAGHCSLILVVISLAMRRFLLVGSAVRPARRGTRPSDGLDLPVLQLDGGRAAEDRDDDLHRALLRVHLVHDAVEAVERTRLDLDHVALVQA